MRKFIAAIFAVIFLFTIGAGSFALVAAGDSPDRNPPVFISELYVADAWMSGLTMQNWKSALVDQVYVEGSHIWFIAKISVSAYEDTDSGSLWYDGSEEAILTITSKDNCLDFSSAGVAHFAEIKGMDVQSEMVGPDNGALVEARANKATFKFTCQTLPSSPTVQNQALVFPDDLANLKMDGIFPHDLLYVGSNYATRQKDYYLHFMAIANKATEGVCTATLKVDDAEAMRFLRDPAGQRDRNAAYTSENWWAPNDAVSAAQLNPGDRSYIYRLSNSVNNKAYSIMKISGQPAASVAGFDGPFNNTTGIYVIMNSDATQCYFGIAVSGTRIQGLVYWDVNQRARGVPGAFSTGGGAETNELTWDASYYSPLVENLSGIDLTVLGRNILINATELRALFSFFGIARTNPAAIDDVTFLGRGRGRGGSSGAARESSAEARYNVSSDNPVLDDLFVTDRFQQEVMPWPSPTAAPTLTLPGSPIDIGKTPEPSAEPSPSP